MNTQRGGQLERPARYNFRGVPTMNKSEYQTYLASREWALLKEAVRTRSNGKCERCRILDQEATHHLTYERIGKENIEDLQAICGACHSFISGKSEFDPIEYSKKLAVIKIYETLSKTEDFIADLVFKYAELTANDELRKKLVKILAAIGKTEIFMDVTYKNIKPVKREK
jgi:hypothetical protein